jgi:hypothetical protein
MCSTTLTLRLFVCVFLLLFSFYEMHVTADIIIIIIIIICVTILSVDTTLKILAEAMAHLRAHLSPNAVLVGQNILKDVQWYVRRLS